MFVGYWNMECWVLEYGMLGIGIWNVGYWNMECWVLNSKTRINTEFFETEINL